MSVYRARSNCPICNNSEEVWFLNGKVEPLDVVECPKCSHMYEPDSFISSFLEMRNNLSISSNSLQFSATL